MRLGIISDCIHVKTKEGIAASEVHIFVRQMEALAVHFTTVVICCPFKENNFEKETTSYSSKKISFVELPEVGGDSFQAKLNLIKTIPIWIQAFRKVNKLSDIVYQRFPNNLNIPGFFYFYFKRKKVFATYTGTWENENKEPLTYSFQKWLLKKWFRGPVWVYSNKKKLTQNIFGGYSPSYSLKEWENELDQVENRINYLKNSKFSTLKLITVGALIGYKNQQYILNACLHLKNNGIPFHLKIVGDGPLRSTYEKFIQEAQLENEIQIIGSVNFLKLKELYRENDFVVQAPLSEGFGKVPVEGFFHGVIPVINNVTMASFLIGEDERGFLFDASIENDLANKLIEIYNHQQDLHIKIENGRKFAKNLTLESWSLETFKTIKDFFEKE